MAILRRLDAGIETILPGRTLIGRSLVCDLVLPEKNVSSQHAAVEWTGAGWQVQDLGSRNGTYLDDERVAPNTRCVLNRGAHLRFGRGAPIWVLLDDSPPEVMARALDSGEWCVAQGGYLALPNSDTPECSIYQAPDGGWVIERDRETTPLAERATISIANGQLWRISLPGFNPGTVKDGDAPLIMVKLRLRFRVSLDEEQVELTGFCDEQRLDLQIRAHHYPLLILARLRLADQSAGVPEPERGWVKMDDLLEMLRMNEDHLNINIHRARTQLSRLGVLDAASLVERRPRMRRLRLGVNTIEITGLDAAPSAVKP